MSDSAREALRMVRLERYDDAGQVSWWPPEEADIDQILSALQGAGKLQEWQPIATAPFGKPILLTDDLGLRVWIGGIYERPFPAGLHVFIGPDVMQQVASEHDIRLPTHWMPAPPATVAPAPTPTPGART